MADNRQAIILAAEHLLKPLCPLKIADLGFNPNFAQLRRDDFTAAPRIGGRWQFLSGFKPVWKAGLGQKLL